MITEQRLKRMVEEELKNDPRELYIHVARNCGQPHILTFTIDDLAKSREIRKLHYFEGHVHENEDESVIPGRVIKALQKEKVYDGS